MKQQEWEAALSGCSCSKAQAKPRTKANLTILFLKPVLHAYLSFSLLPVSPHTSLFFPPLSLSISISRVSLYSPGQPKINYVAKSGLKLTAILLPLPLHLPGCPVPPSSHVCKCACTRMDVDVNVEVEVSCLPLRLLLYMLRQGLCLEPRAL